MISWCTPSGIGANLENPGSATDFAYKVGNVSNKGFRRERRNGFSKEVTFSGENLRPLVIHSD